MKAAKLVYAAAYFLTSNADALRFIGQFCARENKPFAFNLAAGFLLHTNYDDIMSCLEYADYVFANQDEASDFAVKQGLDRSDRLGAAKFIAQMKKANNRRPRVVMISQGPDPVLVVTSTADEQEPSILEIEVPSVPKERVIDTNGAGDSLSGGFLAGLLMGKSVPDSIKEGIALAQRIIAK